MARPEESLGAVMASAVLLWCGLWGLLFLRRLLGNPDEGIRRHNAFLSRWMRAPGWATDVAARSLKSRGLRYLFAFWFGTACVAFVLVGAYVLFRTAVGS